MLALQAVLLSATVAIAVATVALCRRYANRSLAAAGRATRAALAVQDALADGRGDAEDAPTAGDAPTDTMPRLRHIDPPEIDQQPLQTLAQHHRADASGRHRRP